MHAILLRLLCSVRLRPLNFRSLVLRSSPLLVVHQPRSGLRSARVWQCGRRRRLPSAFRLWKTYARDRTLVLQRERDLAAGNIPEFCRAIPARGRQRLGVGSEGLHAVARELLDNLILGDIEQRDTPVPSAAMMWRSLEKIRLPTFFLNEATSVESLVSHTRTSPSS